MPHPPARARPLPPAALPLGDDARWTRGRTGGLEKPSARARSPNALLDVYFVVVVVVVHMLCYVMRAWSARFALSNPPPFLVPPWLLSVAGRGERCCGVVRPSDGVCMS